jgi:hypothetical protein
VLPHDEIETPFFRNAHNRWNEWKVLVQGRHSDGKSNREPL